MTEYHVCVKCELNNRLGVIGYMRYCSSTSPVVTKLTIGMSRARCEMYAVVAVLKYATYNWHQSLIIYTNSRNIENLFLNRSKAKENIHKEFYTALDQCNGNVTIKHMSSVKKNSEIMKHHQIVNKAIKKRFKKELNKIRDD